MRPKFVIAFLLLTVAVLGGALLLKQHTGNAPAEPAKEPELAVTEPPESNEMTVITPPAAPVPVAPVATNTLTPEQREAAIDAEVDRVMDWSRNDDPASLSNILAALRSPEKEVRETAIEAAKQFGSTNAIPALKAAADATEDIREKIEFLEAADFLTLPPMPISKMPHMTLDQKRAQAEQARAAMEARRQADLQKRSANQGGQTAPGGNTTTSPNQ